MPWRTRNYAPPLRRLRFGLGVVPIIVAAVWAWQSWDSKYDNAVKLSRQNAALISEYTLRSMQNQLLLLNQVDQLVTDNPKIGAEDLHRRIRALDLSSGQTTSIGVIDANGDIIAGSRTFPLRVNFAHREYFKALRDGQWPVFIDRVVQYPSQRDTLTVARRLSGDGFRGVVTASAEIRLFADFLAGMSATGDATAFLLRADGKLLVRPNPDDPAFMMLPDGPVMTALATAEAGFFYGPGRMDGIGRIYAFQKIGDLPLYALHGFSRRGLLQALAMEMLPVLAFLVLFSVLGYVALMALVRRVEAERAWREAEFDRQLLRDAQQMAELKETMLKEMSHRVHNNLQMIQALIQLRRRNPGDPAAMLHEIGQRIWAISEVHTLLYNTTADQQLDMGTFLRTMVNNPSIVPPEQAITVNCHVDKVEIGLRQAVPAALIVLEALTNALKHAFPGDRGGVIEVTLRRHGTEAEIIVADDGVGMPDIRMRNSGMKLNQNLAAQLHGELEISARHGGGTLVRLRFPLEPDEGIRSEPSQSPVVAAW